MLPTSQFREINIKDYFVVIKRRLWVIIACFVIVTVGATINTFKKTPLYQAAAKVLIEKSTPQVTNIQQVYNPSLYMIDREYIQSQVNILTSRSLAKKVTENFIVSGDPAFKNDKDPVTSFLGGVSISPQIGTQIINVGYVSTDPIKAAKFANALTNAYIKFDIEQRSGVAEYAMGWLEGQLRELKKKLEASETALNDYIQKNQIVSLPDAERETNSIIESAKSEKVRIENEIAEFSKRYKPKHPKMVALNTKLDSVNRTIQEETNKLFGINEKMIKYNALKRDLDSNKSLFDSLLKRTKETEVSKDLESTNLRVIDFADVPKAPFSPNRRRDIQMAVIVGLILGFGLAFLLEYLDSTVKTAEDIETYVRLPFLGYVPSDKQEAKTDKDIDLICHKMPQSRIAEAYRSIRTSLIFSAPEDKPLKTVLITSTSPQEGKTTVVLNLGTVFANANEKTLIIEADMRKPRVAKAFNLDDKEGLSSYLAGASDLNKVIKQTAITNLSVISSGPRPPNPAELLGSAKVRSLLEELKTRFDRIIIDSPPLLTVVDSAILANIADGVIDVIRAGFLNIDIILRGRQRLAESKARIIGVILNNVNVQKEDSYYYYHYYYAKDKEGKT